MVYTIKYGFIALFLTSPLLPIVSLFFRTVGKLFISKFQLKKRLQIRAFKAKLKVSGERMINGPAAIRTRVNGYLRNNLTSKPIRISWLPYEPAVQQ